MRKRQKNQKSERESRIDPRVKDILVLLAGGTFLVASLIMPSLPLILKPFLDEKRKQDENEWKKFNTWRLKQILKRMHQQKLVEITEKDGVPVVSISENGRRKLLKFNLEEIVLKDKKWDGKWRIIIYDIYTSKRWERELFRRTLKKLNFFKLQRSVYLTPYKCYEEIEYLRQVCNIGEEVIVLAVSGLENEAAYKQYFGI